MVLWILFITIMSFIFIYASHNIFVFFKSTLTTPKIKDYIHSPTKSYDDIYKTLNKHNNQNNTDTSLIDNLQINNENTKDQMKNDLKSFLKNQLK